MTRHPKRRGGRTVDGPEDQIRRELAHRGLPEPEAIALVPGRWMDYTRTRPGGAMRTAHQAIGAELTFAHALAGPLALGGLSHFGLGRFTPVP
jgi:CRISPR-associated protein Csb2